MTKSSKESKRDQLLSSLEQKSVNNVNVKSELAFWVITKLLLIVYRTKLKTCSSSMSLYAVASTFPYCGTKGLILSYELIMRPLFLLHQTLQLALYIKALIYSECLK